MSGGPDEDPLAGKAEAKQQYVDAATIRDNPERVKRRISMGSDAREALERDRAGQEQAPTFV